GLIFVYVPSIPPLRAKQVLVEQENFLSKNSQLAKKYKGFRKFFNQKELTNKKPYAIRVQTGFRNILSNNMPAGIRAAFYVTWNQEPFYSLQRNIHKLNLSIPKW